MGRSRRKLPPSRLVFPETRHELIHVPGRASRPLRALDMPFLACVLA